MTQASNISPVKSRFLIRYTSVKKLVKCPASDPLVTAFDFDQVKASLRSVLTEEDEEMEIVPHVKGSTDFEVYESVLVSCIVFNLKSYLVSI